MTAKNHSVPRVRTPDEPTIWSEISKTLAALAIAVLIQKLACYVWTREFNIDSEIRRAGPVVLGEFLIYWASRKFGTKLPFLQYLLSYGAVVCVWALVVFLTAVGTRNELFLSGIAQLLPSGLIWLMPYLVALAAARWMAEVLLGIAWKARNGKL